MPACVLILHSLKIRISKMIKKAICKYSLYIYFIFQEYDKDLFKFIIFYLYFAAILCQFILHCVAEKSDDADPSTPEEKVPLMLISYHPKSSFITAEMRPPKPLYVYQLLIRPFPSFVFHLE